MATGALIKVVNGVVFQMIESDWAFQKHLKFFLVTFPIYRSVNSNFGGVLNPSSEVSSLVVGNELNKINFLRANEKNLVTSRQGSSRC